jgi:hypothetical protein
VPQEPVARLWHAATLLREHRGDGHDPRLGHRGEQVVARDLPHGVAEGAAAVEDDGPVEAVATADAALGQLEILHGDAGEHVVAVDLAVQDLDVLVVGVSSPRETKARTLSSAPTSAASPTTDDSMCSTWTLRQLSATPEPPPRPFVLGRSIRPRMHDRAYPPKEGAV